MFCKIKIKGILLLKAKLVFINSQERRKVRKLAEKAAKNIKQTDGDRNRDAHEPNQSVNSAQTLQYNKADEGNASMEIEV